MYLPGGSKMTIHIRLHQHPNIFQEVCVSASHTELTTGNTQADFKGQRGESDYGPGER
jgi:hypothetical protein